MISLSRSEFVTPSLRLTLCLTLSLILPSNPVNPYRYPNSNPNPISFVKVWPEGCDPQTTDTHWRAKKGKGSWNYRLLFDVELGHNTRAHKFPYLHFQLWDKDILKYNDCIGEQTLDVGKFYRRAYRKNMAVNFFESTKGGAKDRKEKSSKLKATIPDPKKDIPPEDTSTKAAGASSPYPNPTTTLGSTGSGAGSPSGGGSPWNTSTPSGRPAREADRC